MTDGPLPGRYGTLLLLSNKTGRVATSFPIDTEVLTFGREQSCDVRMYFPVVSSLHAKLVFEDGKAFLSVIGRNGAIVDGNLAVPSQSSGVPAIIPLEEGSQFTIHTKTFRYEYPPKETKIAPMTPPPKSRKSLRMSMIDAARILPSPAARITPSSPSLEELQSPVKPYANHKDSAERDVEVFLAEGDDVLVSKQGGDLIVVETLQHTSDRMGSPSKRGAHADFLEPTKGEDDDEPPPPPRSRTPRAQYSLHRAVLMNNSRVALLQLDGDKAAPATRSSPEQTSDEDDEDNEDERPAQKETTSREQEEALAELEVDVDIEVPVYDGDEEEYEEEEEEERPEGRDTEQTARTLGLRKSIERLTTAVFAPFSGWGSRPGSPTHVEDARPANTGAGDEVEVEGKDDVEFEGEGEVGGEGEGQDVSEDEWGGEDGMEDEELGPPVHDDVSSQPDNSIDEITATLNAPPDLEPDELEGALSEPDGNTDLNNDHSDVDLGDASEDMKEEPVPPQYPAVPPANAVPAHVSREDNVVQPTPRTPSPLKPKLEAVSPLHPYGIPSHSPSKQPSIEPPLLAGAPSSSTSITASPRKLLATSSQVPRFPTPRSAMPFASPARLVPKRESASPTKIPGSSPYPREPRRSRFSGFGLTEHLLSSAIDVDADRDTQDEQGRKQDELMKGTNDKSDEAPKPILLESVKDEPAQEDLEAARLKRLNRRKSVAAILSAPPRVMAPATPTPLKARKSVNLSGLIKTPMQPLSRPLLPPSSTLVETLATPASSNLDSLRKQVQVLQSTHKETPTRPLPTPSRVSIGPFGTPSGLLRGTPLGRLSLPGLRLSPAKARALPPLLLQTAAEEDDEDEEGSSDEEKENRAAGGISTGPLFGGPSMSGSWQQTAPRPVASPSRALPTASGAVVDSPALRITHASPAASWTTLPTKLENRAPLKQPASTPTEGKTLPPLRAQTPSDINVSPQSSTFPARSPVLVSEPTQPDEHALSLKSSSSRIPSLKQSTTAKGKGKGGVTADDSDEDPLSLKPSTPSTVAKGKGKAVIDDATAGSDKRDELGIVKLPSRTRTAAKVSAAPSSQARAADASSRSTRTTRSSAPPPDLDQEDDEIQLVKPVATRRTRTAALTSTPTESSMPSGDSSFAPEAPVKRRPGRPRKIASSSVDQLPSTPEEGSLISVAGASRSRGTPASTESASTRARRGTAATTRKTTPAKRAHDEDDENGGDESDGGAANDMPVEVKGQRIHRSTGRTKKSTVKPKKEEQDESTPFEPVAVEAPAPPPRKRTRTGKNAQADEDGADGNEDEEVSEPPRRAKTPSRRTTKKTAEVEAVDDREEEVPSSSKARTTRQASVTRVAAPATVTRRSIRTVSSNSASTPETRVDTGGAARALRSRSAKK